MWHQAVNLNPTCKWDSTLWGKGKRIIIQLLEKKNPLSWEYSDSCSFPITIIRFGSEIIDRSFSLIGSIVTMGTDPIGIQLSNVQYGNAEISNATWMKMYAAWRPRMPNSQINLLSSTSLSLFLPLQCFHSLQQSESRTFKAYKSNCVKYFNLNSNILPEIPQ